jgi:hypothetical protein
MRLYAISLSAIFTSQQLKLNPLDLADCNLVLCPVVELEFMNGFPERWIINLPRCLPAEKFPTFASGRQGRGPIRLSGFHPQFPRARLRDVAGGRMEESPAYGDGSALASWIRLACDNRASAQPFPRFGIFPVFSRARQR